MCIYEDLLLRSTPSLRHFDPKLWNGHGPNRLLALLQDMVSAPVDAIVLRVRVTCTLVHQFATFDWIFETMTFRQCDKAADWRHAFVNRSASVEELTICWWCDILHQQLLVQNAVHVYCLGKLSETAKRGLKTLSLPCCPQHTPRNNDDGSPPLYNLQSARGLNKQVQICPAGCFAHTHTHTHSKYQHNLSEALATMTESSHWCVLSPCGLYVPPSDQHRKPLIVRQHTSTRWPFPT